MKLGGVNHTAFGEGIHGFQSSKAMVIGLFHLYFKGKENEFTNN